MSAIEKLEKRLAVVEAELAKLKEKKRSSPREKSAHVWLEKIYGAFANDPEYLEAMRLGREYRDERQPSPKSRKIRKKSHVAS
jgi:hypothetical protein